MRRLFFLAIPLLLAAAPPISSGPTPPRDSGVTTLAADAEDRWVPFTLTPGNQISFQMLINGQTVTAILDTGVSYSVLARGSPAFVAAKAQAGGSATAIGGAVTVSWMPTGSIVLGGLTRSGGSVAVADLPAVATGGAKAVDMLVGRDLLAGEALDIDYQAHRFRLLRSGRMPFSGAVAPLTVSPERQVYESEITLGGARLRPMIVDTGDGSAITVTAAGWAQAGLNALPSTTAVSFGLAGPAVTELAIVPSVSIGELKAKSVEVRVEPANGFSQAIGAAGRIGSGFLQHYRVLLDPGAKHMVLSRGPGADTPPLRSTSGLLVGLQLDAAHKQPPRLRVLHVMKNGPGDTGGWKDGETICSINGAPITLDYPSSPLATWSIAPAGTKVKLGMCDGTTRELTTRDFY